MTSHFEVVLAALGRGDCSADHCPSPFVMYEGDNFQIEYSFYDHSSCTDVQESDLGEGSLVDNQCLTESCPVVNLCQQGHQVVSCQQGHLIHHQTPQEVESVCFQIPKEKFR